MSKKRRAARKDPGDASPARESGDRHEPAGEDAQIAASRKPMSVAAKLIVSALLAFHLLAVAIFPLAFAAQNESPSVMAVANAMRPYGKALYLDHGYFFFAPNPGPSHLVQYRLEFVDGRPPLEGRFPDLKRHWPRLLYHRHFMLAEHLNARYVPPEPPTEASQRDQWRSARDRYERHLRSFEQHLLATHGADRVTLVRLEHDMPLPDEFLKMQREGIRLDDPEWFVPLDEPQRAAAAQGAVP